jgi:hypothetical protein
VTRKQTADFIEEYVSEAVRGIECDFIYYGQSFNERDAPAIAGGVHRQNPGAHGVSL